MRRDASLDAAILAAYRGGMTTYETAAHVGVSCGKVWRVLVRNRVQRRVPPAHNKTPAEAENRIVELCQAGLTVTAIAKLVGVSIGCVSNVLKRRGVPANRAGKPWALSDKQVWDMRVVALCCRSWTKLGCMFGVGATTARQAVLAKTYKHVPSPKWVRFEPVATPTLEDVSGTPWTAVQACEMYVSGKSVRQVARHFNVPLSRVLYALKRAGVETRKKDTRTPPEVEDRIVLLRASGMSVARVARRTGVTRKTVSNVVERCSKVA